MVQNQKIGNQQKYKNFKDFYGWQSRQWFEEQ